ncbi:hypothetical protein [Psychrobacter sp. NPDC078501]|uniref:hypothetical protein n=1 Tax=Psychrobacter sp. NPDC078501 TaxID=3364495 RepID=UPI0038501AFD
MFNVTISLKNDIFFGEFLADSYFFEPSKYDYAFYLYKGHERIATKAYSENTEAIFDIDNPSGIFSIKVIVRDKEHGDKRSFYSEKINFDC